VWQGTGHIAGAAAAIAFVIPEPPDERRRVIDQYDVGQATMAMMIVATDLGIGTGHSSVGDQDKARAVLGVPDGYQVAYLLGAAAPRPAAPPLPPSPAHQPTCGGGECFMQSRRRVGRRRRSQQRRVQRPPAGTPDRGCDRRGSAPRI
jgi:hypothetical protein